MKKIKKMRRMNEEAQGKDEGGEQFGSNANKSFLVCKAVCSASLCTTHSLKGKKKGKKKKCNIV